MAKVKFTQGRVAEFKCSSDKIPSFLWDSVVPGLGLRVTPGGAKSYIFQAKLKGKVVRLTIGDPAIWDILSAQKEAARLRVIIDEGRDPRLVKADVLAAEQEVRDARITAKHNADEAKVAKAQQAAAEAAKQALLARTAWNAYMAAPHPKWGEQHRTDHTIAASPGGIKSKIGDKETKAAPLAALLAKPLFAITADVVQEWLEGECATRPTFAHNSYRKFRTFIQWCAKHPEFAQVTRADCCLTDEIKAAVPSNKTKEGDCLQREQLPAWFAAVRQIRNPVISTYLQALLITGARRGELAGLRWADVDFEWRSMTIRDKIEGTRTIPLTPYLAHLLGELKRINEARPKRKIRLATVPEPEQWKPSPWVFSSPTAADGKLAEPRIAHTKALRVAGLPHVSLHGLRRSFGTLCEWVEMPSGISAQIMGHKPSALVEKHYRRRPLDLLRKWHDLIEAWVLDQAGIAFTPQSLSCAKLLKAV